MIRVCKQNFWFIIELKALVKWNPNIIFRFVFLKINFKANFSLFRQIIVLLEQNLSYCYYSNIFLSSWTD